MSRKSSCAKRQVLQEMQRIEALSTNATNQRSRTALLGNIQLRTTPIWHFLLKWLRAAVQTSNSGTKDDVQWPSAGPVLCKPGFLSKLQILPNKKKTFHISVRLWTRDFQWLQVAARCGRCRLIPWKSLHRTGFAGVGNYRTALLGVSNMRFRHANYHLKNMDPASVWDYILSELKTETAFQPIQEELQRKLQALVGDSLLSAAATELLGPYSRGPRAKGDRCSSTRQCTFFLPPVTHTEFAFVEELNIGNTQVP